MGVEVGASGRECVAVAPALDYLADHTAEVRYVRLNGAMGSIRRVVTMDALDQRSGADLITGVGHQQRQYGALIRASQLQPAPVFDHLDRTQNPELHPPTINGFGFLMRCRGRHGLTVARPCQQTVNASCPRLEVFSSR